MELKKSWFEKYKSMDGMYFAGGVATGDCPALRYRKYG